MTKEKWCEWCVHSGVCMGDECSYQKRADIPKGAQRWDGEEFEKHMWDAILEDYGLGDNLKS